MKRPEFRQLPKAWDRPPHSGIPNRNGDRNSAPIYTALGRAVSAWEGVQAAIAGVFAKLIAGDADLENRLIAFGDNSKVHDRAKQIKDEAVKFFARSFANGPQNPRELRAELKSVLAAYRGWAERRNDLAHGYVTPMRAPDYNDDDQPMRKFHSLLPSHSRITLWIHEQPIFNYVAAELRVFAKEFVALDKRMEALAARIGELADQ